MMKIAVLIIRYISIIINSSGLHAKFFLYLFIFFSIILSLLLSYKSIIILIYFFFYFINIIFLTAFFFIYIIMCSFSSFIRRNICFNSTKSLSSLISTKLFFYLLLLFEFLNYFYTYFYLYPFDKILYICYGSFEAHY